MTWNTGPWMEEKVQVVTGGGNTIFPFSGWVASEKHLGLSGQV